MHSDTKIRTLAGRLAVALLGLWALGMSGCAALSNPLEEAVPVNRLPPEVLGRRKSEDRTIPMYWLRQQSPDAYRLAPGDILGVWVDLEGFFSEKSAPPPVQLPTPDNPTPALGYPVPVRDDGIVTLPLIEPVRVDGMTLREATEEITKAYTVKNKILKPGREQIIVTLMRPRTYQVLVVRQDSGGLTVNAGGGIGQTKRGTGYSLELPAYKNDVLNALTRTGGLPGVDAMNEVIIERGALSDFSDPSGMRNCVDGGRPGTWDTARTVRIPLRMRSGEPPPFRPDDVILHSGDIVFIETRDFEVFYTAGLLGASQIPLPRDYDLDVFQALALAGAPLINGAVNTNNLSGNVTASGIGTPSPSLVTILRETPNGGQIPIRIDLDRALRDRHERVLMQPGDILVLQQTPAEAITGYFSSIFHMNFFSTIIRQRDLTGTATLGVP